MSIFKCNPRLLFTLGALSMAAALAACGGGDDPVDTGGGVAVVALPAVGTSTGLDVTGTLNYLVFSPDGSHRPVSADVANDGSSGSLTLNETDGSFVVSTGDAWLGASWPEGSDGLLELNGHAGLICDTASNAGQVGISGNVVQVTDLAELRGKSFRYMACANGAVADEGGIAFNDDGSAQFEDADGVSSFGATEMAAYFSEAGWSIEGGTFKARAFSRTTSSGTEYAIVDISDDVGDGGSRIKTVALMVEVQAPR
ncbi:hypothetical protein [Hydrogenophaga sp.]|uniref:hypothetical protein n=1 Tax=Hydrogenophaga sp. TaxID=1904254 RepID=UPI00286E090E|nr:hypothetical protein [Hydrogenophaga sp.]